MTHNDIILKAAQLVQGANDPGECMDYRRAVRFILQEFATIARPKLAAALREAASRVDYPPRATQS
jgi:hypothetical protein